MNRKLLLAAILIFAFASVFKIQPVKAIDIHVPYDYDTIQEAIDAAVAGDHIYVTGGPYHEHITINKAISLVGEDEATIDGDDTGTVVTITANGVSITNFKIFNAGSNWGTKDSGIKIESRNNCFIMYNWINNSRIGIYLQQCSNIRIIENTITHNVDAVLATYSPYTTIQANTFQNNSLSVYLDGIETNHALVKSNTITDGGQGIHLQYYASNNTIINNWVMGNEYGIMLSQSQNNTIYHNNFIENTNQAWTGSNSLYNKWDIGWPTGGNHWSNHNLKDDKNGQYQNQLGSDGICDSVYTVYGSDIDKYPLAAPVNLYEVPLGFITEEVNIISNSTITHFQMNTAQGKMIFNVTGETGTGFCRVDIPNTIASVWQDNYTVLVDGESPTYLRNWTQDITTYIYFKYQHSEHEVTILPELQPHLILLMLTASTLLAAVIRKRKQIT